MILQRSMMLDMIRFPCLSGDSCKAYRVLAWRASAFQHAITDEIAMDAVARSLRSR
jgi:hypothetical protein